MNPSAALQSTVEDFLEALDATPEAAQAELITLVLRACGCNDTVDADNVMDYDGVVSALDDFTELLKQVRITPPTSLLNVLSQTNRDTQNNSPVYPLTSKLPMFKKFRKSLSEFIDRLIASSADLGSLYTSDLITTLSTWIVAMSSSQIRSFRHTATVIALETETALCDVAAAVEKEAEVLSKQRDGERKKKTATKGLTAREKELEKRASDVRDRRSKLAEFIKEFVDGYVQLGTRSVADFPDLFVQVFSFIAIVTSIQVSELNACVLLAIGSRSSRHISWKGPTSAMSVGFYQT